MNKGDTVKAVRLENVEAGRMPLDLLDTEVCYWNVDGGWWIYLPGSGAGRLVHHVVKEHEDKTITVTPSIGLKNADGAFSSHGFLTRGVWREV